MVTRRYGRLGTNSGVHAFDILDNAIIVQFRNGSRYLYTYNNPGPSEVEIMKRLALAGTGLATYINKKVRKRYARKL